MADDILTVAQAAKVYGCSTKRIYEFIKKGTLKTWKHLGRTVVSREAVIELSEWNREWRESVIKGRERKQESKTAA